MCVTYKMRNVGQHKMRHIHHDTAFRYKIGCSYKQRKTDEAKQKIVRGQNFKRVFSQFLHNKQQTYALGGGGGGPT
jgi:hypothetical protein